MNWIYLILAIIFEIIGTTLMKISNGFSIIFPTVGTLVSYIICFSFLSFALKTMEIGVAYAIWCGFGIALVALIGIVFFHEDVNWIKILSLVLIIIGVSGLNLGSKLH